MRSSPSDSLIEITSGACATNRRATGSVAVEHPRLVLLAPPHVDRPWNRPFVALAARLQWSLGYDAVEVARLDARPYLADVLADLAADGADRVRILPLFLAMASHLRRELRYRTVEAARAHPEMEVRVLPLLGEENGLFELLEALARRQLAAPPDPRTEPDVAPTRPRGGPRVTLLPVPGGPVT